jgi:uncharacterized protein
MANFAEILDPADNPVRMLPVLDDVNRFFWTSGADGKLRFMRCNICGFYLHPPQPICRKCLSRDITPHVVSGRAKLMSFTVNHQPWLPDMVVPFVIGLVELAEQKGLRLTTNIVDCNPDDIRIGMDVEVCFQKYDDIYLPLFRSVKLKRPGYENLC